MQVYSNNRSNAEIQMLEFNGMASALLRMMEKQKEFSGTYSDLIGQLEMHIGPRERLPQTSHGVAAELKRIRPAPMGRAYRYQRRISHIVVVVAEK